MSKDAMAEMRDLCRDLIEAGFRLDAHERAALARINRNLLREGRKEIEGDLK